MHHVHSKCKYIYIYIYIIVIINMLCCQQQGSLDPLSPPVSNIHRSQDVFQGISYIGTTLLYIGFCWSSCLCSSMWRSPQEYTTDEFIIKCPAVSRLTLVGFLIEGRWSYSGFFLIFMGCCLHYFFILFALFLRNRRQDFSPYVLLPSM